MQTVRDSLHATIDSFNLGLNDDRIWDLLEFIFWRDDSDLDLELDDQGVASYSAHYSGLVQQWIDAGCPVFDSTEIIERLKNPKV